MTGESSRMHVVVGQTSPTAAAASTTAMRDAAVCIDNSASNSSDDVSMPPSSPRKQQTHTHTHTRYRSGRRSDQRAGLTPATSVDRQRSAPSCLGTSGRLFFGYEQVTNLANAEPGKPVQPPASPSSGPATQQPSLPQSLQPNRRTTPVRQAPGCSLPSKQPNMLNAATLPLISSPVGILRPIDLNSALQPHEFATATTAATTATATATATAGMQRNNSRNVFTTSSSSSSSSSFAIRNIARDTVAFNMHAKPKQLHNNGLSTSRKNKKKPTLEGRELSFDEEASLDTSMATSTPRASPTTYSHDTSTAQRTDTSRAGTNVPNSPTIVLQATTATSPFPPDPPKSRQTHRSNRAKNTTHVPSRSPNSIYRTWDGRTVLSKNPFSPMITDDSIEARKAHSQAQLFRFGRSNEEQDNTPSLSLPSSFGVSDENKRETTTPFHRHKFKPSSAITASLGSTGTYGTASHFASPPSAARTPVRPAKTPRSFTFTGSPIPESGEHSGPIYNSVSTDPYQPFPHSSKVRRLSREDDVASHGTMAYSLHLDDSFHLDDSYGIPKSRGDGHGWKRLDLQVRTDPLLDDDSMMDATVSASVTQTADSRVRNKQNVDGDRSDGDNQVQDVSPTDVSNFPGLPCPSSKTRAPPATPMKQQQPDQRYNSSYRSNAQASDRNSVVGYTSIRKIAAPPPTPLPNRNRRRRPDILSVTQTPRNNTQTRSLSPTRGLTATPTSTTTIRNTLSRDEDSDSFDYDGILSVGERRHDVSGLSEADNDDVVVQVPSRFASDFDIIGELGKGSFGIVYKVLSKFDGCLYAIKEAHRPAKGAADRDRMLKEVYALAALSDQADTATFHIVRYHQAWMEDQRLYIQTELCTSTLADELRRGNPQYRTQKRRYKCLREILLALEYIHRNGMVHLDIKPENIFLKNDQHKLGDFGLVSEISYHKDVEEGDSRYMSLELLSGEHDDLTKSDIFSLGITLYEVCLGGTKTLPTNGPQWQALRSGTIDLPQSPLLSDGLGEAGSVATETSSLTNERDLYAIIRQMMNPRVDQRPSAADLLKRPQLLSDEQKALLVERNKAMKANRALLVQQNHALASNFSAKRPPNRTRLVRSNTWNG